ncbi:MAG: DUF1232 domain-containing protein [Candidatus Cloacimonetes bacterium]|nr:DUF1232 domain-containing protein [Candidatus Cloacimonadota bacterium]
MKDERESIIPEEISQEDREKIREKIVDGDKKLKFYEKLRGTITKNVKTHGGKYGSMVAEYVMALPDFFILLIRLAMDSRVSKGQKFFLAGIIAYIMSPIDIIPDFIPVIGYVDDLVLVVYGLNLILNELSPAVLLDNWSGSQDVLGLMQNISETAEKFIDTKILKRIRTFLTGLRK